MPITPNQGPSGGGTLVTITGTNLSGTTAVHFGTRSATSVTNVSPTQVTAVSPAGNGAVGVTVTTPGGTSNPVSFFYVGAPFKQSLSPATGTTAGGQTVTINGTGLATASSVAFGANSATPTVVSDSQITVTAPAGTAGSVGVTVTTAGGSNNGLTYTYVADPTLTAIAPTSGPASGGTSVILTGTSLTSTTGVTFGGTPASFGVLSDTSVAVVTPAGAAGAVDVVLTNEAGSDTLDEGYTYLAGPDI